MEIRKRQELSRPVHAQGDAFSDDIVGAVTRPSADGTASSQSVPKQLRFEPLSAKFMCQDAIRILSGIPDWVSASAFSYVTLAFGQLHHDKGVVFGEAIVEANRIAEERSHLSQGLGVGAHY